MAETKCTPACAPNTAQLFPSMPSPTQSTAGPTTASGVDCDGNTVTATGPGVVQSVPHPDAVQKVQICSPDEFVNTLVRTGLQRLAGNVTFNAKQFRPGLQSVTLTVLAGEVSVSMQDGFSQPVPAGVSLSWSVTDTDDSSLSFATFTGMTADTDFIVSYTYKDTAEG